MLFVEVDLGGDKEKNKNWATLVDDATLWSKAEVHKVCLQLKCDLNIVRVLYLAS